METTMCNHIWYLT